MIIIGAPSITYVVRALTIGARHRMPCIEQYSCRQRDAGSCNTAARWPARMCNYPFDLALKDNFCAGQQTDRYSRLSFGREAPVDVL
jgi:hypothetical protein